jgi:ubiquinone/menaquinone biosynthesis C-methylase UbiE
VHRHVLYAPGAITNRKRLIAYKDIAMDVMRDPEKNEINALLDYVGDLAGKRVLEIGAGSGRLTWRYAELAGEVVGIDPKPERVAQAREDMPKVLHGRVVMLEATLAQYQHKTGSPLFDVALMSWAL